MIGKLFTDLNKDLVEWPWKELCDIEVLSAEKSVDRHIMAVFMAGQGKLPYFI